VVTTSVHFESWPDFLTVEQAAAIVRIGRTSAYGLARRYLASDGAEGLPVIRIGKQLRVPRVALERWLGGALTPPPLAPTTPVRLASVPPASRRRRSSRVEQEALFGS
jgi:hypothetical protein